MPIGLRGAGCTRIGHMMRLSKFPTPRNTPNTNSITGRAFMQASEADYGYAEVQDVTQPAGQDNINDQAESFWGGEALDIPSNEPATFHSGLRGTDSL